ncbi:MAG: DUF5723 family protein [Prevotellaceae bacterium]|nr:DUF5723 family protein [Prevotellaceae bacterium]
MKNWFSILILVIGLLLPAAVQAQYLRTSYFMDGTSARMQLNPALQPRRGYFNLPVIGSTTAEASSNALGVRDIYDILDSSGDFYSDPSFLSKLKTDNSLNVNLATDLLALGWHKGKNFWSINATVRADIEASIPRTMFDFLNEVSADNFSWANTEFDIKNQSVRVNAYTEIGIGYSRMLGKNVSIGIRPKLLLGMGNIDLKLNRIHMRSKEAGVDSEFELNTDATMESSVKGLELDEDEAGYIRDIEYKNPGIAGYGGGIDLGLSVTLLKRLSLSASLIDLGFISWSKSSTQIAQSDKSKYINKENWSETPDPLDFDLYGLQETEAKSRSTSLSPTLVLGGEYAFLPGNKLSAGILSTTRLGQLKNYSELTLSAAWRPNTLVNAALSYSMLQGGETFGFACKIGPLMLGTDYIFLGNNSKHVNAHIGLCIPLGKKRTSED